jgi:hypothetical protein
MGGGQCSRETGREPVSSTSTDGLVGLSRKACMMGASRAPHGFQESTRRAARRPAAASDLRGMRWHERPRRDPRGPIPVFPLSGLPAYVERRETRSGVDCPEQLGFAFRNEHSCCTTSLPWLARTAARCRSSKCQEGFRRQDTQSSDADVNPGRLYSQTFAHDPATPYLLGLLAVALGYVSAATTPFAVVN